MCQLQQNVMVHVSRGMCSRSKESAGATRLQMVVIYKAAANSLLCTFVALLFFC